MNEFAVIDRYFAPGEKEAVRRPLSEASMLPPRCYHDPAFYALEEDRVFRSGWLPVGRVEQVPETGDFFTFELLGEALLVVRTDADTVQVFSNVCRHRQARLANGCGNAKAFVCPYHKWTYGRNGSLRGTPYMTEAENFDRKDYGLHKFATEIWNGFVLVNLDGGAASFASANETLSEILRPYGVGDMVAVHMGTTEAHWDWKLTFDNFTEGYHHIGVHPESLRNETPDYMTYPDYDGDHAYFWISDSGEEEVISFFPSVPGLPTQQATQGLVLTAFPFMHLMMNPDLGVWLQLVPLGHKRHRIEAYALVPKAAQALPDYESKFEHFREWISVIVNEDVAALGDLCRSVGSQYALPGRYSVKEASVHHFHKWLVSRI